MRRAGSFTALICFLAVTSLQAQRSGTAFTRWEPELQSLTSVVLVGQQPDSISQSRGDYRYEGLAFGGLAFGVMGAWLGSRDYQGICPLGSDGSCDGNGDQLGNGIAFGLVGAALGGGLGYLVGRASAKKPRPDPIMPDPILRRAIIPDSVRHLVGYQHWRGAGIGAAVGGLVGAVAGAALTSINDCADCESWSAGHAALVLGLLGTGTGSVVGFLAGLSSPKYEWIQREQ